MEREHNAKWGLEASRFSMVGESAHGGARRASVGLEETELDSSSTEKFTFQASSAVLHYGCLAQNLNVPLGMFQLAWKQNHCNAGPRPGKALRRYAPDLARSFSAFSAAFLFRTTLERKPAQDTPARHSCHFCWVRLASPS